MELTTVDEDFHHRRHQRSALLAEGEATKNQGEHPLVGELPTMGGSIHNERTLHCRGAAAIQGGHPMVGM